MQIKLQGVFSDMSEHRDLLLLLVVGGLYSLGIFLSNTFVNVYLWKQAGDYITIAIYNLGIFTFQPLTFILAGLLAKRIDRVFVLRMGIVFLSLFFLSVLIIADKSAHFNFMLGSILGIGYGFYWLAFNVLTFEITEPDTRDIFNGVFGILQSFGGMVSPPLAGFIIARMSQNIGYTTIFSISFILFIVAVIVSFFIKRRRAEGKFHFKKVLEQSQTNLFWRHILYSHVAQGIREGVFLFVITIWVFVLTDSELALGIFNLVFSGVSIVSYIFTTTLIKPSQRKRAIFIGGFILYISLYIILFKLTYIQLIIYAICIGIAYPIINVPYISLTYDVIGKAKEAKEMRIEYIVVRELFANIGRVISIVLFLLTIYLFPAKQAIPYLLACVGLGYFVIYFFIQDINLHKNDYEQDPSSEIVVDEKKR